MRFILPLTILLFAWSFSNGQTSNIYVSTGGKDTNRGTLQSPFKTISKALTNAGKLKGQNVRIELLRGTYYADTTLILKSAAMFCRSLTISAYKNQQVTISAGRRLQLHWAKYKNGIYRAAVPKGITFERLYINQQPQVLARYPDYNDTSRVYHGTAADALSLQRVSRWKNPAGGYIHALHEGEWGSFDYLITGKNADGTLKCEGGWQNNRPSAMNKQYRFIENIFEELDAPGEWYLDRANAMLYYYPQKGLELGTALVEAAHLKNTIELRGTTKYPLSNVTINNINFRHNERSFMDTREPLVRSDWSIYRGGAVLFEGTENCSIKDCTFEGLGGNAVMFSNYNKRDTVRGCLIDHIGASAVCFIGDPKAVRSPLFRYEASQTYQGMDKTAGPLTSNYPQECVVTDNLFHDLGEIEKQATGVQITMSAGIVVSHNSIYIVPRAGLNINDGCWGGHILAYNDVFNTVLETGDHGSFNSWGRDRYWSADRKYMDSIVAVHPELILLDAVKTNEIHDNRFRCDHGWDMDLDDGSTNYHIYNNLCLNGGIKLREGFYRIVENNILINNTLHPHAWFKNSSDVFEHNIVMKKYQPYAIKDWGHHIDSNLFTTAAELSAERQNGTDMHSIAAEPMFANAKAGDFTIAAEGDAAKIGFKNIAMDDFGVQKPELKRIALTPLIPLLVIDRAQKNMEAAVPFLGGSIRSVHGLDERSALGLPDATGVILVSAGANGLITKSGLHDNDVIVAIDNTPVAGVAELLKVLRAAENKSQVPVTIYRNQQVYKIKLQLK